VKIPTRPLGTVRTGAALRPHFGLRFPRRQPLHVPTSGKPAASFLPGLPAQEALSAVESGNLLTVPAAIRAGWIIRTITPQERLAFRLGDLEQNLSVHQRSTEWEGALIRAETATVDRYSGVEAFGLSARDRAVSQLALDTPFNLRSLCVRSASLRSAGGAHYCANEQGEDNCCRSHD
jgi:hypothetical protein